MFYGEDALGLCIVTFWMSSHDSLEWFNYYLFLWKEAIMQLLSNIKPIEFIYYRLCCMCFEGGWNFRFLCFVSRRILFEERKKARDIHILVLFPWSDEILLFLQPIKWNIRNNLSSLKGFLNPTWWWNNLLVPMKEDDPYSNCMRVV